MTDIILRHKFYADFVVFNNIILEVKALSKGFTDEHIAMCINYLKVSGNNLALLVNFGMRSSVDVGAIKVTTVNPEL